MKFSATLGREQAPEGDTSLDQMMDRATALTSNCYIHPPEAIILFEGRAERGGDEARKLLAAWTNRFKSPN